MNKKKKLIIAAAVATVLTAAAAITAYAYLQNTINQPNQFSVGEDKVSVVEEFTEPTTMTTSNTMSKVVTVKNDGTSDQFVRVYLDFSDSRSKDKSKLLSGNDTEGKTWDQFLANLPADWAYVSDNSALDGYFYYTKILKPGDSTTELINGIKTDFSNVDNIKDFDIIVYTESVQTTEIDANGTVYTDGQWRDAWTSFLSIS